MKLSNLRVLRETEMHDALEFLLHMRTARRAETEIRRKEWPKCERKKREKERERSVRPIVVREFARQEHYREKMFRDCALERDVFGSLVYVSPGLPPPRRLPCFILVYHPVMRSLPRRLPRNLPRRSRFSLFPPFSFNRNRRVSVVRGKKISIDVTCGCDVFIIRICLQPCFERSAGANDDREKA